MNRFVTLSLCSLPISFLATTAFAQGSAPAAAPPAPAPDFSKVEIKPHQVAGNVYYLEGQGGNVGVLVGDDGVLMIYDQFAPLTDKIMAAVKKLSQKPVRLLINTHVHGDHVGRRAGLVMVAHVRRCHGHHGHHRRLHGDHRGQSQLQHPRSADDHP